LFWSFKFQIAVSAKQQVSGGLLYFFRWLTSHVNQNISPRPSKILSPLFSTLQKGHTFWKREPVILILMTTDEQNIPRGYASISTEGNNL